MLYDTQETPERVVLIGIDEDDGSDTNAFLDELEELIQTAGGVVIGRMIQRREGMHRAHYFGKGKLEELKAYADELGAESIVCDDELTASQIRNMSSILDLKVMDRTLVILDIFAARASSAEGKVQVELAQLKYKMSHLTGHGKELSRLGGGIGTRGPGEKKLETDRRRIADKISELNSQLKEIEKRREVLREKRIKNGIPIVALIGYTNAGKSTMMNTLTNAGVLAEDKLFATLDTTTRQIETESGSKYLFTDTVGFIQKLPHNLIKAFKATLEESKYADILLHIVDASNDMREVQMQTVYETLRELGCLDKPVITVFNKTDKDCELPFPTDKYAVKCIKASAKKNVGIDKLLSEVEEIVKSFKTPLKLLIPYANAGELSSIYGKCEIIVREDREDGTYLELYADEETENRFRKYTL
ncbi:MAG: GTPase HflX [Firmicutes bacterium]|nr:GTPase HflX [Bacillota bacterium]